MLDTPSDLTATWLASSVPVQPRPSFSLRWRVSSQT